MVVTCNFTVVLLKISDELTEREVRMLKFLCRNFISASDLENAKKGYHIFDMLEKAGKLSDDLSGHRFLKHLLLQLQRADLIEIFRTIMKPVSPRAEHDRQFGDFLKAIMLQIEDQHPDIEDHPLPSCGSKLYESEVKQRQTKAEELGNRTAVIVYTYLYEYNRALMLYDYLRAVDGLRHLERFHDYRQRSANLERVQVEDLCIHLFQSNLSELKRLSSEENQHSNEKLGELAFLLHEMFTDNPNSKGIVLVRMKVATTAIQDFIKKSALLQALPCRVFPLRFVGQGDIEDGCMTEFEQMTVLENFRDRDACNVLVTTYIAQDGLDMPAYDFIIDYDLL